MRDKCLIILAAALAAGVALAAAPSGKSADGARGASTRPAAKVAQSPATPRAVAAPNSPFASGDVVAAKVDFQSHVRPLLQRYCFECHGDGSSAGELDLDTFNSTADVLSGQATWQKVIRYARTQTMPPPDADRQPTQAEREELVAALQRQLFDPARPDPGRITLRRLNRTEYRNTIRDLLGVSFDPTIDFPQDDTGYGFDNIADVLTLPPMLMEKYLAAAEKALDEAVPTGRTERQERKVAATDAKPSFDTSAAPAGDAAGSGWVALSSAREDSLSVTVESAAPAEFVVRVLAYGRYRQAPPPGRIDRPPLRMSIMRGDVVARDAIVTSDETKPAWYESRVGVPRGRHQLRVAMRRERGVAADRVASGGRVGPEQPGLIFVKEIHVSGPVAGAVRRIEGEQIQLTGTAGRTGAGVALHRTDERAIATFDVAADGHYLLRAQACAEHAGDEPAKMELLLDGKPLETFEVSAPAALRARPPGSTDLSSLARRAVPQVYEVRADLKAGKRELAARFVNNHRDPEHPDENYRDRNVYVNHFEVVELSAPPSSPPMTDPMRRLFARHVKNGFAAAGAAEAKALLADFARRAWRRPPLAVELERLTRLFELARSHGEEFAGSAKHAMKAILASPNFLFRGEPGGGDDADAPPRPVSEFELASRLSYFLWSTTPDDELLKLAERGALREDLDAQVKRMLASPKANALVENFAGQWLQFRNLDASHPDRKKFPTYSDRLRDAMKRETQLFFESILREDRSVLDVLTADYTFLNERLARHYGIGGVEGEEFRRVSLADKPRRGVLTHGSVLTLTSNPTRTSPVKRGKWVLESLLGAAPPPPPPEIPSLEKDGQATTGTVRQQLEKHRADVTCASCHAAMDPVGFALENFDAIGRWRDTDGAAPVDASAKLPDGKTFTGPIELARVLAETRKNDVLRSVTESALTFALGRGVEPHDYPAVDQIIAELRKSDGKFSTLVTGVVKSVPFQMRRGGGQRQGHDAEPTETAEVSHER
ncbi:MAG TPA: DUF1592 domain-containing protein [Tepidisphaeraceae bacterium]|nr:DUF1592 domain-containing protein [Tepidisphaeraceae bacterium]